MAAGGRSDSQPCTACGLATSPGTPRFAGRRVIRPAGAMADTAFLCASCEEELCIARGAKRLSDAELRQLIEHDSIAGRTYAGLGDVTSVLGGGHWGT
jgi:hypothetical protein